MGSTNYASAACPRRVTDGARLHAVAVSGFYAQAWHMAVMDADKYVYTESTSFLEELCTTYHGLDAELYHVKEKGRQLTDEESDEVDTPGWDTDMYGYGVLANLKADIEMMASTDSEANALINKYEKAVEADIAKLENEMGSYPPA